MRALPSAVRSDTEGSCMVDEVTSTAERTGRWAGSLPLVFGAGAAVGLLGGMVGLGGAEFRLPLLIGLFGFAALAAVIVNKAMGLVVVISALPARLAAVPLSDLANHWVIAIEEGGNSLSRSDIALRNSQEWQRQCAGRDCCNSEYRLCQDAKAARE